MSEFGSMNTELAFIYEPDVINAALRRLPRELQDVLGWWMMGTANAGAGVLGGFGVSEGAALRSDVTRGAALAYTSGNALPLSKWSLVYSPSTLQATHDAHGASARYDLLSLSFTTGTDTTETQGQVGDVPASVNTQRGCQVTLVLTKGAGGGDVPATPAGNVPLWAARVPATSGAIAYYDHRAFLPGPTNRPSDAPIAVQGLNGDTFIDLMLVRNRALLSGQISYESALRWDWGNDWPHVTRSGSLGAGEVATELYPMLIPGDRKWRRNVPVGVSTGPVIAGGSDAGGLASAWTGTQFTLSRSSSSRGQIEAWVAPVPVDGRGLKALSAKATIRRVTAFDGTVTYMSAVLCVQHVDGTVDAIGVADLDGAAGGVIDVDFTGAFVPTVLAEDDVMYVKIVADTTGNTTGTLYVYAVSVELEEGHE